MEQQLANGSLAKFPTPNPLRLHNSLSEFHAIPIFLTGIDIECLSFHQSCSYRDAFSELWCFKVQTPQKLGRPLLSA